MGAAVFIPEGPGQWEADALRAALIEIFFAESVGGCHVDTAVEHLLRVSRKRTARVLSLVRLISSSVSDLLAFTFLENVNEACGLLADEGLEAWVRGAIAIYESEGLHAARSYLARVSETALPFSSSDRARTREQVVHRLRLLISGLAGRDMAFRTSEVKYTDTETIHAPEVFSRFADGDANELHARSALIHACCQVRYRSFHLPQSLVHTRIQALSLPSVDDPERAGIQVFLELLADAIGREEAFRLYALVDTIRIEARLRREFPGLDRDLARFKAILRRESPDLPAEPPISRLMTWILEGYPALYPWPDEEEQEAAERLCGPTSLAVDSASLAYLVASRDPSCVGIESMDEVLPYVGTVRPEAVARVLLARRIECRERFVEALATILLEKGGAGKKEDGGEKGEDGPGLTCLTDGDQGIAVIVPGKKTEAKGGPRDLLECLTLLGQESGPSAELDALLSEIESDLGSVPSSYVSGAMGLASRGWAAVDLARQATMEEQSAAHGGEFYLYDEWDFRRGAHRKSWCTVRVTDVPAAGGDFVLQTLRRYRGQVLALRKQFEMLRPAYRLNRRQREGEDIDLDAVVEAVSDLQARVTPSERLFIRQRRDERDIAVLFLVDMSASTAGWVNQAIKETLVLLSEALHVLGDRYAVHGFSGMRRTGCQFYRIKDFGEPYGQEVKARISGIDARDYTRMGPAIRHASRLLADVDARFKVLITLSDGKPEDYDEYKGLYAIEDTRMALVEAKEQGVRPFCITVDREAHEYLPHMYGEVNYVIVDDVSRLSRKVPEIYRLLTT